VAFTSFQMAAGGLVGPEQVYLRDMVALTTIDVSIAASGGPSTGRSYCPMLSGDGRFVVFISDATDLVLPPAVSPDHMRVQMFVRDLVEARTMRIALNGERAQPAGCPSISADGRYIAFVAGNTVMAEGVVTGNVDVFVHDRSTGTNTRIAPAGSMDAKGSSELMSRPSLSGNGRVVAFVSEVNDLVAGDTNGKPDVFVQDRESGDTIRASVAEDGVDATPMCRSAL
jgi:Tol biopolymer transport system component